MSISSKAEARGYFSIRYVIPGYTFIIGVLLINYPSVFDFISSNNSQELLGIMLGFATLLSGSAMGFLVSQIYWWVANRNGGLLLSVEEFQSIIEVLKGFGYRPPNNVKEQKRVTCAILDICFYLDSKNKQLLTYVWRRWDMYTLLSSTYYALGCSLVIGLIFRFIFEVHQLGSITWEVINTSFFGVFQLTNLSGVILIVVVVLFLVLFYIIKSSSSDMITNYYPAFEAHIRYNFKNHKKKIKKIFPNYF